MKQRTVGIVISIVTIFVVLEVFSLGWFAATQGGLFYSRGPSAPAQGVDTREATPGESVKHRAHPYFGFVKISDPQRQINNHGFSAAPYDYPYVKRDPRQYLVGVFGGSVAAGFVKSGGGRLAVRLGRSGALAGRDIVVLSFAQGGYKQPQQLLTLSYYLTLGQELDAAISLDGFNEVALSHRNDVMDLDISMPSADHILPLANLIDQSTLTTERIESLARITRLTAWVQDLEKRRAGARLASAWFGYDQAQRILAVRLDRERLGFQGMGMGPLDHSLLTLYSPRKTYAAPTLYERAAVEWANASILMNALLKSRGVPYHHILQPNQYFSKKRFTEEEKRLAITVDHPYRAGAERGYPALLAQAERLISSGVDFHSGVGLFDHESATVYADDCCHFNERGYALLADFIADVVLERREASTRDHPREIGARQGQ
jgi:hypothetical protein